jgi:hypothetical protein
VTWFCVWTDHQAGDARTVPKLVPVKFWKGVFRPLSFAAIPLLNVRRFYMIIPAAPVVPGNKNRCSAPKSTAHNRFNLVNGPLHSLGNILWWVFAPRRFALTIDPGNRRQLPSSGVLDE